jgi:hypothetical protein
MSGRNNTNCNWRWPVWKNLGLLKAKNIAAAQEGNNPNRKITFKRTKHAR